MISYEPSFPPYYFTKNDPRPGIHGEVFSAVSRITKDKFVFEYVPTARALVWFEENKLDIEPGINPAWRQSSKVPGIYTIPYAKSVEVVLFRPGKQVRVKRSSDLKGKTVGLIRGYIYPTFTKAFANREIIRKDSVTEIHLLRKLEVGRIDQVFINKVTAQYWMKKTPAYKNLEIGDEISSLDVMLRLHPNKKGVLDRLNKALKHLVESGEIDRIYARYR
ncbi:transporter substrate-binding domain-containing protein [Desulfobacterales bacterium HSG17]|nr:transporter substrate-binding domain-containing protein [Desulfobacterales bacterium HSG17]